MNPSVVVTGGARRLGKAIAIAFARRDCKVAISYHKTSKEDVDRALIELQNAGAHDVMAVEINLEKLSDGEKLIKEVAKSYGAVDVLVNSAAVFPESTSLEKTDEKLWDSTFTLNLKQQFFLSQEVIALQKKLKLPLSIVNIASLGGLQTWKRRVVYNVSKAGIIALTKSLAREVAEFNMRVNAVAPGGVDIPDEMDGAAKLVEKEYIPMGRYAQPDEVASAVVYLALDASYITGQLLAVDGGRLLFSR